MTDTITLLSGEKKKLTRSDGVELTLVSTGSHEARVYVSPYNRRIQVLGQRTKDYERLARDLASLAEINDLTKVFLKARESEIAAFQDQGYIREAKICGYFNGQDAHVLSRFLSSSRLQPSSTDSDRQNLEELIKKTAASRERALEPEFTCRLAESSDVAPLAALYGKTFASYPFPVDNPEYVRKTMKTHVVYRIVTNSKGTILAAASGETNKELGHAEMTDFATTPEARGHGLATYLLTELEEDMRSRGIVNLHTLSRAGMAPMNAVFQSLGYRFTGTLIKNCSIGGKFEDMHCWCKQLGPK